MKVKNRIKLNRASKVGSNLICPMCGSEFIKRSYQHTYCSLTCKDKRHNQLNPDRHRYSYIRNVHYYDIMDDLTDNEFDRYFGDQD